MTREEFCAKKEEALASFQITGELVSCELYGNGHINDSFFVIRIFSVLPESYILLRMYH